MCSSDLDLLDKDPDNEDLMDELRDLALSLEVRSCWQSLGEELEQAQYRIVLCTGGPHVEVQGDLDAHGEPCRAMILHQDWGSPLFEMTTSEPEKELMLWFAQSFYWGR